MQGRRVNTVARLLDQQRVILRRWTLATTECEARASVSRSAASFSGSGTSCTRYSSGCLARARYCAVHVRRQHHLFDQLVCIVANGRADARDAAVVVEREDGLLPFKVQRATAFAHFAEQFVERVQCLQRGFDAASLRLRCFERGQLCCDLGIGQPRFPEFITAA